MTRPSPRRVSSRTAKSKILAAFSLAQSPLPFGLPEPGGGSGDPVRSLPLWVGRYGFLSGPNGTVLWCEPSGRTGEAFPSQFILDAPPGRYFVDIFDSAAGRWISRESAEGGPLVAGLPYTGGPVVVLIRGRAGRP
jgi:hypothetical protein